MRVFLGGPRLVLLDRADRDLPRTALEPLQKIVASARLDGAAVLWITENRHVAENLSKTSELSYTADETGVIPWMGSSS